MDQHTGGKWLIHGTKRRKDNQLQSLELPCRTWCFGESNLWWFQNLYKYVVHVTNKWWRVYGGRKWQRVLSAVAHQSRKQTTS